MSYLECHAYILLEEADSFIDNGETGGNKGIHTARNNAV